MARRSDDEMGIDGDDLIVTSRRARDSWQPTRFRRTRIVVEGRPYFIAASERDGARHRYRLRPWPTDRHDAPRATETYDAEYLADERRLARADRVGRAVAPFVRLLGPVLGLLPAVVRRRLHERYGLHPLTCVRQSLMVEYALLAAAVGMFTIDMITSGLPEIRRAVHVTLIAVGLDVVVRYGASSHDELDAPGFWEWLPRGLIRLVRRA